MFSDIELDYGSIPGGTPVIPISYIGISHSKWFVFCAVSVWNRVWFWSKNLFVVSIPSE